MAEVFDFQIVDGNFTVSYGVNPGIIILASNAVLYHTIQAIAGTINGNVIRSNN